MAPNELASRNCYPNFCYTLGCKHDALKIERVGMTTSLTGLQKVSGLQAQLIELYQQKIAICGSLAADTSAVIFSRTCDRDSDKAPPSLDFVNTSGRRVDENKATYATALKAAQTVTASTGWEQVRLRRGGCGGGGSGVVVVVMVVMVVVTVTVTVTWTPGPELSRAVRASAERARQSRCASTVLRAGRYGRAGWCG